jgi:hypothetical protein
LFNVFAVPAYESLVAFTYDICFAASVPMLVVPVECRERKEGEHTLESPF